MGKQNSVDLLRTNLATLLLLDGEWADVRLQIKSIIQSGLRGISGIKYCYSGDELLFDTSCVSDENTLNVLKLYRQIVASLRNSSNQKFIKLRPKIESFSKLACLHTIDDESNSFMSDLQSCRTFQNRIVCKYNDRGYKASYFQTFEYDLSKVTELVFAYRFYDSAYKNFCLYFAINKIFLAETYLLETLKGICESRYNIFTHENDCWGGVMCALKIVDFFYLTNRLTDDTVDLIRLCLLLLNIYIKYHRNDNLRTMECYANRARLNERLYKSFLFIEAASSYSEKIKTNPIITKYLCMYDLEQAKLCVPNEYDGEYNEKNNYMASQLMLYQNQGLGIVLPDGGDVFDAPFNDVIQLGRNIAVEIENGLKSNVQPTFNSFISHYQLLSMRLKELVNSQNVSGKGELNKVCCLSWAHQLESYSYFGMKKAKFTPVKYPLNVFLQNAKIDRSKIEKSTKDDIGKRYLIKDIKLLPDISSTDIFDGDPIINQLIVLTDNEDNLKAFRCYGRDFKQWVKRLRRYHYFMGVAVRPFGLELYNLQETVDLQVCFQIENDINL